MKIPLDHLGCQVCIGPTARTAASRTACTMWGIMCMWSLQRPTCSPTSSALRGSGKIQLVRMSLLQENTTVKLIIIILSFQFNFFSCVDVIYFICRTVWSSEGVFFLLLSFLSCFFLKDSTNRKFFGQHVLFLVFISTYPQIVILAGMGFWVGWTPCGLGAEELFFCAEKSEPKLGTGFLWFRKIVHICNFFINHCYQFEFVIM